MNVAAVISRVASHGSSLVTAVVDGMYTIGRWKLPSNLLSRACIRQILTPPPEPALRGKGKGLHICHLHLHSRREVATKKGPNVIRKPLKFCQYWTWQHWRQKEEAAHIPWDMWCPLLCLLKFYGWEGKQFVGLADTFLLCKYTTVGTLCLPFIRFENPKVKCCLLSLLCLMSNTLWMVNKRHIVFLLFWMRMTFSHESCLLQFLSKTHKVHTFPKKGHC